MDEFKPVLTDAQIVELLYASGPNSLLKQIARKVERAAIEAYERRRWISVADKLPAERQPILMVSVGVLRDGYVSDRYAGWYLPDRSEWVRWPHPSDPTHWQPLPLPPTP